MEALINRVHSAGGGLLLALFLLLLLWWLISLLWPRRRGIEDLDWPYVARVLMTDTECVLFARLQQALPEYLIFTQVQLSRIIEVKIAPGERDEHGWLNRINRMSVDFVICAADGQTILAAIELDDASHERKDRQVADAKKDRALVTAGIRVIRWPVRGMPDARQIRSTFLQTQKKPPQVTRVY